MTDETTVQFLARMIRETAPEYLTNDITNEDWARLKGIVYGEENEPKEELDRLPTARKEN